MASETLQAGKSSHISLTRIYMVLSLGKVIVDHKKTNNQIGFVYGSHGVSWTPRP